MLPTANNSIEDKKEASNAAATKKSLLNTSYSSEEILLQAASSLQGLEGECNIMGGPQNAGDKFNPQNFYMLGSTYFVGTFYACLEQHVQYCAKKERA